MSTTLFVLDAMRHDYINNEDTPFLKKCSEEGEYYRKVIPNLGFCERTEIFTGLKPNESGFLTAIGYDPENSPFKHKFIPKFLLKIENKLLDFNSIGLIQNKFYTIFRRLVNKILRNNKSPMNIYNIPLPLIHYWALTEDKIDHRDPKAFNSPSIFSLLTKNNKSFYYDSFTSLNIPSNGSDKDRINMALNDMRNNNNNFYLVYISSPDSFGHRYGPNSIELKKELQKLDKDLKDYVYKALKFNSDSNFIFLGDHGMENVKEYFNAEKEILKIAKRNFLVLKKDFIYFLDSTVVRIWFFSTKAKEIFSKTLIFSDVFIKYGTFIDEDIAKRENLPFGDRRYGDISWWANSGVLVYPDFFHRTIKFKGMHGYDPKLSQNQGTCIVYGSSVKNKYQETISLASIFDVLKNTLNI